MSAAAAGMKMLALVSVTSREYPQSCQSIVSVSRSLCRVAKFDPEGFQKMMAELNAEDRGAVVARSPYDDLEPDPEYLSTGKN